MSFVCSDLLIAASGKESLYAFISNYTQSPPEHKTYIFSDKYRNTDW